MDKLEITGRVIAGVMIAGVIDGIATLESGSVAAAGGGTIRAFGDKNYSALDAFQNGCAGGAVVAAIPAIACGTLAALGHPVQYKGGSSTVAGAFLTNALVAGLGGAMTHNKMGVLPSLAAGGVGTLVVAAAGVALASLALVGVAAVLACTQHSGNSVSNASQVLARPVRSMWNGPSRSGARRNADIELAPTARNEVAAAPALPALPAAVAHP